ncbi:MAG: M48 family metalloprotease [Armatimonadota bacterium]|nr:M48 family metalloprotease [Armatimonadota bacterium]
MSRRVAWALVLVVAILAATVPPRARAAPAEDREIQIGRQGAQQLESRLKIITDPAIVDRVARIGATVSARSQRPGLPYSFKVVDVPIVNAVAFPGGFIYVTAGLLKFVRSDHELAAVLAHEVAHAALGHGMEMMRRANQAMFITLLIAIVTRDPALVQGGALFSQGLLAGYTRDLERAADLASIDYLTRTPYSPVAILTVLERLNRQEMLSPQPEPVFADHPKISERVQYVEEALRARRIPLNRRAPMNYLVLTVREGHDAGVSFTELWVNDRPVLRLADAARVRAAAEALDRMFDDDLLPYEIVTRETTDGWGIFVRGHAIVRVSPRDVPPGGGTPREFATTVASRLRLAIEDDIRRRRMDG